MRARRAAGRRQARRSAAGAAVLAWAVAGALAAVAPAPAQAGRGDHDRAREAVAAGELLPLHVLLERVSKTWPGQVLEVELEREGGTWVVELKLLRPDGRLVELEVDGGTARVLRVSEDGRRRSRDDRSRDDRSR